MSNSTRLNLFVKINVQKHFDQQEIMIIMQPPTEKQSDFVYIYRYISVCQIYSNLIFCTFTGLGCSINVIYIAWFMCKGLDG